MKVIDIPGNALPNVVRPIIDHLEHVMIRIREAIALLDYVACDAHVRRLLDVALVPAEHGLLKRAIGGDILGTSVNQDLRSLAVH